MRGASVRVEAMSCPQVRSVVPVASRISENRPSEKADGLKMCVLRPSRRQRTNSLPRKPAASMANCRWNQSSRNQRKRLVLKMMGNGPNPSTWRSRRDHDSSRSNA